MGSVTNEISTTHEYAIAQRLGSQWIVRKARFDTLDAARYGVLDLFVENDPNFAVVMVTTSVQLTAP